MKADVEKLDIYKLVNVRTSLSNFKTTVDDLDAGKLKTGHIELNKLSDAVTKEVVKSTEFDTLNTKVNNL